MAKRKLSIGSPSSGKKPRQEIPLSPAKITEPAKRTDVEGIIRSISESPRRKGESPLHTFFDGELSDEEQIVRMMGYDKSQLNKLQKFCAPSYSATRWWSKFEVIHQVHNTFGDVAT